MLKHWVWLAQRPEIGPVGQAKLLRLFGTAENIYALTQKRCEETEDFDKKWLPAILDKELDEAEKIIGECDKKGIQILTFADRGYPERLRSIADPPALLYYRGSFPDLDREATIAVVGTRKCSNYGMLQAKQFASLIAHSGGIVVSGGARGIDSIALGSALNSLMPVVCVLGCGVDICYPKENRALFDSVISHGCLVSEFPPGTPPLKEHFPRRNRIVSGLSVAVLVVEAPSRSGAMITVDRALSQGRDVYTIPGNIGVKQCEGNNRILREGAMMAMDGWDLLSNYAAQFPNKLMDGRTKKAMMHLYQLRYGAAMQVYSPISTDFLPQSDAEEIIRPIPQAEPERTEPERAEANLSEDEKRVLSAMEDRPLHSDVLIARSGLTPPRALAALTMLQIKKLILKSEGNQYQRL